MEIAEVGQDACPVQTFEAFFRENFAGVARAGTFIIGDPASGQDAAQEAFLRLHQRWSRMESDLHARNFVYKVAINQARSHVRKHLRLVPSGLAASADRDEWSSDPHAAWIDAVAALRKLSRRQRACVVLVDYVGMDSEQAARTIGISASTVRVHLARGRQILRDELGLEDG